MNAIAAALVAAALTVTLGTANSPAPPLAPKIAKAPLYDLVLRGGTVYDGSGGKPFTGDVAVNGDRIVKVGDLGGAQGKTEVDAHGLAVSPGFVNMLSW